MRPPAAETRAPARTCVHVITELNVGGAELMLERLVAALDGPQMRHRVISLSDEGAIGARLRARGIDVRALGLRWWNGASPLRLRRLTRWVRDATIVQTWLYHADLFGLLAARLAGVPHVLWNIRCSSTVFPGHPMTAGLMRLNARWSHWPRAIIVNSEAGRQVHIKAGYAAEKFRVIPNGFDVDRFRPRPELRDVVRASLEIPREAFVVGMVANWSPFKDHALFARAAQRLHAAMPEAWFLLVGKGIDTSNSAIEALFPTPMRHRVRLLGPRTDVPHLLAAFDTLASCSNTEGFPNVLGEAMASGVPCVATDVGDCGRLIDAPQQLVPAGDAVAMAAAWQRLARLPVASRHALGQRSRARIVDQFSLPEIARAYAQLYDDCVAVSDSKTTRQTAPRRVSSDT